MHKLIHKILGFLIVKNREYEKLPYQYIKKNDLSKVKNTIQSNKNNIIKLPYTYIKPKNTH